MSIPEGAVPNFADAAAATRNLINEANAEPAAAPQVSPEPAQAPVDPGTTETAPAAPETAPLTWEQIDFNRPLTPEEQQFVKDGYLRQSDYTRKTQEAAEMRKQIEQFGDIESVQAAVEFASSLQDPANLRQLKAEIEEYLANEAGTAPVAPTTEQTTPGLDPAIQARIDALEARFAEQEHLVQEAQLEEEFRGKFQSAEDSIRADYPYYDQSVIDTIYSLTPATEFDLFKARELYEQLENQITNRVVGNKGNFPDAANSVRSDTLVTQPTEINTLEGAREASKRLFAAE